MLLPSLCCCVCVRSLSWMQFLVCFVMIGSGTDTAQIYKLYLLGAIPTVLRAVDRQFDLRVLLRRGFLSCGLFFSLFSEAVLAAVSLFFLFYFTFLFCYVFCSVMFSSFCYISHLFDFLLLLLCFTFRILLFLLLLLLILLLSIAKFSRVFPPV